MQAYIDRNISVCLHFYGFRHTKNAPFAFMDKRAIENRVENAGQSENSVASNKPMHTVLLI